MSDERCDERRDAAVREFKCSRPPWKHTHKGEIPMIGSTFFLLELNQQSFDVHILHSVYFYFVVQYGVLTMYSRKTPGDPSGTRRVLAPWKRPLCPSHDDTTPQPAITCRVRYKSSGPSGRVPKALRTANGRSVRAFSMNATTMLVI